MKPSERFVAWLDKQLDDRHPGARLPTTARLAADWGLSAITISRLLEPYHKSGKIIRIPRRGTFVAPLEEISQPQPPATVSSVENIVETVKRSIADGSLRRGDALPSVKYMSHQFRVASRTVIAAYRRLAAQTHVERVGKTYWVGAFASLNKQRRDSSIYLLKAPPADFRTLFANPEIGMSVRAMETELVDCGCVVHYGVYRDFPRLFDQWKRSDSWPQGVVFGPLQSNEVDGVLPLIESIRKPQPGVSVSVLAFIDTADYRRFPGGVCFVGRGILHTALARAMVRYITACKIHAVTFFMDYDGANLLEFFVPIKTRTELRSFDQSFPVHTYVTTRKQGLTRESFLHDLRTHTVPNYRQDAIMGKYRYTPMSDVEADIELVKGRTIPFKRAPKGLWFFNRDNQAAAALEWAKREGVKVPEEISIISLENDPRWYASGISTCRLLWNNAGYLMAHALLGDIVYEKTTRGFMRVKAAVVHRTTTLPV